MYWNSNLKKQPYAMSSTTHKIYSDLVSFFKEECPNYIRYTIPKIKKDSTLEEVAGPLAYFFPAHYYKLIPSLTCFLEYANNEKIKNVIVLDIGAGIGTTYYALIDLCEDFQFSFNRLNYIYVDNSTHSIDCRKKCMDNRKTDFCTNVYIESPYPDCINHIIDYLKTLGDCHLLICMSNFLNWVDDESKLVNSIYQIIKMCPQYDISILNVESKKIRDRLVKFTENIDKEVFIFKELPNKERPISYLNPPMSPFYNKRKCHSDKYYMSLAELTPSIYNKCNNDNITSALYGALYECKFRPFYDEVELKLYNKSVEYIVNTISSQIKSGYIYNSDYLEYGMPKKDGSLRPVVVESLVNEIINSFILKYWGSYIDSNYENYSCYGNIISNNDKEYKVYNHYFQQYFDKYLNSAKKYKNEYPYYAKIDLKSFYKNIDRKILINVLLGYVKDIDKKYIRTLKSMINRPLRGCEMNMGIPQGSISSGFMANLYLHKLDEYLADRNDCKYVRYVDDIFIFANSMKELQVIIDDLKDLLEKDFKLDVHNSEEVNKYCIEETLNLNYIEEDLECKQLNDRITKFIESIYFIDSEKEYERYNKEPMNYCKIYSKCLKQIGIYLDKDYIYHKLYKNWTSFINNLSSKVGLINWLNKKGFILIKWIDLPDLMLQGQDYENKLIKPWSEKFIHTNEQFYENLVACREELKRFLTREYKVYQENSCEDIINVRRLKFVINKIGTVKITGIEYILIKLLDKPWLLPHRVLRAYPELKRNIIVDFELSKNKTRDDYYYLRSIWLLGEWRTNYDINYRLADRYISSLISGTDIENMLLVEALLKKDICYIKNIAGKIKEYLYSQTTKTNYSYYKLRGAYILLKWACPDIEIKYINNEFRNDCRFDILFDVLNKEHNFNPLDILEKKMPEYETLPDYFHEEASML